MHFLSKVLLVLFGIIFTKLIYLRKCGIKEETTIYSLTKTINKVSYYDKNYYIIKIKNFCSTYKLIRLYLIFIRTFQNSFFINMC